MHDGLALRAAEKYFDSMATRTEIKNSRDVHFNEEDIIYFGHRERACGGA